MNIDDIVNKIHHADCLDFMRDLPDKCVDLVWTDPPYNVKKDYGEYKDDLPEGEYKKWITEIIKEFKRISKFHCIFTPHKHALFFWNLLGADYRQIILSRSPEGAIRNNFINQFSFLLTNVIPSKKKRCKNVWHNCQMSGLGYFFNENNYGHPGYTSEDITSRVIYNFSNENDLILDCFSGTGTTATICDKLNRRFICIEKEEKYIKLSRQRLKEEQAQMDLFKG